MKLHQFREVVAIAEQGSIRAAARALKVSQPGLTRNLAELERLVGGPLFERRARGVVPTQLGLVFVRRATSILHEVRRTQEEMDQLRGASTGTITAGLSIAAHLALLPPALAPFRRRYKDTKLHIIEGFYPTLEPGLRDGGVDFYVGVDPGRAVAPGLSRELVSPNRRTVLCRAGHRLATATSLAQLCTAEWATTSITSEAEDEVGAVFRRHGLPPPNLVLRSQSALTLMTCLLHSDLLAMVPVQWTQAALTRGLLSSIPVTEELAALPVVAITRADLPLTPAATYLLDLLKRGRMLGGPAPQPGQPPAYPPNTAEKRRTAKRQVPTGPSE